MPGINPAAGNELRFHRICLAAAFLVTFAWGFVYIGLGNSGVEGEPGQLEVMHHFAGICVTRQDSWLRRGMSGLANAVRGKLLRDHRRDGGCAMKVFRREIVDSFRPIRTRNSFMPAFAVAAGWRLTKIPVRHRERQTGVSKYGLGTFAWRPMVDMLALWWLLHCRRLRPDSSGPRRGSA